jgi:hypothetical protein
MAVKKAKAKKTMRKKPPVKKRVSRSKTRVGDSYVCNVCGLAVTVDEACDCVGACDIICCDKPMRKRR